MLVTIKTPDNINSDICRLLVEMQELLEKQIRSNKRYLKKINAIRYKIKRLENTLNNGTKT